MGSASRLYRTGDDASGAAAGAAAQAAANAAGNTKLGRKLAAVGEDAAAGAALGSVVGPWGTVVGGAAGAVYGAIDQFGGDVATAFNPPDFSDGDYDRIQQKCINGYNGGPRGAPVGGVAPDQYGSCRYSDGSYSGGDAPFPGSWNIGWDGDGKIVDQAVYDKWKAGPLCVGADGLSVIVPAGMICNPGVGAVSKPIVLKGIAGHASAILGAKKSPPPPPVQIARSAAALAPKVPVFRLAGTSSAPAPTDAVAAPAPTSPALTDRINANAHAIVSAAAAGHPAAQAAIADIATNARAGDPLAQAQAAILTQAAKIQIRAKYFAKYVGRISTGAVPCGCH